jgi:hypothetical protein
MNILYSHPRLCFPVIGLPVGSSVIQWRRWDEASVRSSMLA